MHVMDVTGLPGVINVKHFNLASQGKQEIPIIITMAFSFFRVWNCAQMHVRDASRM